MEINTLKIKLQELESNLENLRVQEVLRKEEFDLHLSEDAYERIIILKTYKDEKKI